MLALLDAHPANSVRRDGASVRTLRSPKLRFDAVAALPDGELNDAPLIAQRAVELATDPARPIDSVCVHGDSPGAVRTAVAVRRALEAAGLVVVTCWSSTA